VLERLYETSPDQSEFVNTYRADCPRLDIFKSLCDQKDELEDDSEDIDELFKALRDNLNMTNGSAD
jgi:hypothetical protein